MDQKNWQKDGQDKTLRDLYFVIFRQKRKVVSFFLATVVLMIVGTLAATNIYQSDAKILIQLGRDSVSLDPTATIGQVVNIDQTRDNIVRSEIEILQSRSLAEEVVSAIGYEKIIKTAGFLSNFMDSAFSFGSSDETYPGEVTKTSEKSAGIDASTPPMNLRERDRAIRILMKNMTIDVKKTSNIIAISYKAPNREFAKEVLTKLINIYLEKHIAVHRTKGSEEFFIQQTKIVGNKLNKAEDELRDLKNKTGIAMVSEQRTILLNRIGNLQRNLEETEANLAGSQARVQSMTKIMASLPNTLLRVKVSGYAGNPVDYIQQRLTDLRLKYNDLNSKYTDDNIYVQEVKRQIAEAQGLFRKEGASSGQMTQLALLTDKGLVSETKAKGDALKIGLDTAKAELKEINDNEVKIARLTREIDQLTASYRNLSEKLEQARIDRNLEIGKISNIGIVQSPSYPAKPISPRPLLNLVLGIFLGAFGGIALGFFSEYIDHTFKKPEDVEKILNLPVITAIPAMDVMGGKERKASLPLPNFKEEHDIPPSLYGNYEAIYNHILSMIDNSNDPQLTLLITSCHRGEGVSTVAGNLAVSLTHHTNGRVLVVDASIRFPSMQQIFGTKKSPGLTDLSSNVSIAGEFFQPTLIKNLDVLAAGQGSTKPSLLFESKQLADLITLAKREYSFILFDVPTLNDVTSAIRLTKYADGVILVIEAEKTRWEVVQRTNEMLRQAKANILGVVLNKRKFYIPASIYRTL